MIKHLLIIYCLLAGLLSAQTEYFERLSNNEGLPQSQVYDILQGHDGYLWIATGGGLARYDGFEITTYNIEDGLASTVVFALYEDSRQNLWVGTEKGLHLFREDSLFYGIFNNELDDLRIISIVESPDSTIWVGTSHGLYSFKPSDIKGVRKIDGFDDIIWNFQFAASGEAYVLHGNNTLSIYSNNIINSAKDYPSLRDYYFYAIERVDSTLYFSVDEGLLEVSSTDTVLHKTKFITKDLLVTSITHSKDGMIWLGDSNGEILSFKDGKFERLARHKDEWGYILQVFSDRESVLWIGTDGNGVVKYNRSPIVNYTNPKQLGSRTVWQFAEYEDDKLLFVTDGAGIKYIQNGEIHNFDLPKEYQNINMLSLIVTSKDEIWFGTYASIYKIRKNGTVQAFDDPAIKYKVISNIVEMNDGSILCISLDEGLIKLVDDKFELINETNGLPEDECYTLQKGRGDDIWIGSKSGLILYRDNKFTLFNKIEGLTYNNIISLYFDHNYLYLGSSGEGLFRVSYPDVSLADSVITSERVNKSDGLLDNEIISITKDHGGNLWCGSLRGVNKIIWGDSTLNVATYKKRDGFLGIECNQNAILCDKNNNIWIGSINGVSKISPEKEIKTEYVPKIFLKSIKAETNTNPPKANFYKRIKKDININFEHNNLRIEYSAISLRQPHKLRFRYKLEGFQTNWSDCTDQKVANYTNLPPGNYKFMVRAFYESSSVPLHQRIVNINIDTPYYKTLWFNAFVIMVVLGLFTLTAKIRENNLKRNKAKLESEVKDRTSELADLVKSKDKLISIISHDLKSPFLSVLGSADLLSSDYDDLEADERKYLIKNMNSSLNNIYSLLENLLTWSRINIGKVTWSPEVFNLNTLISEINKICQNIAHGKNIEIVNNIPANYVLYADRQMAYSIFYNLVINGLKFTFENGNIIIEAIKNEDYITVSVSDTGQGMSNDEMSKLFDSEESFTKRGTKNEKGTGLGFMIIRELVDKNFGEIWGKSHEGEGTTFYVKLPVRKLSNE